MVNTLIEQTTQKWAPGHAQLAEMALNTTGTVPLSQRYRALFSLKGLNDDAAVEILGQALCLKDDSELFKHEVAYCLGQMGNRVAIPALIEAMATTSYAAMVRHEAAESLGALSDPSVIPELEKYVDDECRPLAETCVIALEKIRYDHSPEAQRADPRPRDSAYSSVDPAPATTATKSVSELKAVLCDESAGLWKRYRAMFALRDVGTEDAVLALAEGMETDRTSELFRHEIGFIFGEMQHPASVPALARILANPEEAPMVRHEAAEALGSVATPEVNDILRQFINDPEPVVRDSCLVALDICDHESSGEFQYAIIPEATTVGQTKVEA
ncbi:deoxyhypusine hydroxylase [Coemansia thaxteri]|uniref:Deoxyhypusine hydroxylase n=1 Tax=Coemansia thaxteri TaxID=2663907 RepID=A0A9W8BG67_9FUNG|nr:deoxyhypusine hydroxylase [Coemansia thaxteri]KAJ2007512.1 deoxyhypusine hydroxylase [Coemansia thaxteri]KAJ2470834.1 deoxyhypusine hydroxylase [Coemansia sp. RSA 2322]KAJ2483335.1 deoxyhypusine hydroxylase [Coemansia sp. RSA 2320]